MSASDEDYLKELDSDLPDDIEVVTEPDTVKFPEPVSILSSSKPEFDIDNIPKLINDLISYYEKRDRLLQDSSLSLLEKYSDAIVSYVTGSHDMQDITLLSQVGHLLPLVKDEISNLQENIASIYTIKFPELTSLVSTPLQYMKAVEFLEASGKQPKGELLTAFKEKLEEAQLFSREQILVLAMSVKTSFKQDIQLDQNQTLSLSTARQTLYHLYKLESVLSEHIEKQVTLIAPNMCAIIGATITSQLLAHTGGILEFSKIPSCNISSIGKKKALSYEQRVSAGGMTQNGYIYGSDLVQQSPVQYHKQILRMLCSKITLAARADASHVMNADTIEHTDELGVQWRQEVLGKIEKLQTAPAISNVKPLPIPEDNPKKKRAGRRFRKYKQQFQLSHARQLQNRMEFGKQEQTMIDTYGEEVGFGMLNSSLQQTAGIVRSSSSQTYNNAAKLTKRMQRRIKEADQYTDTPI